MRRDMPRYAVACCMRNEAIFLLEWVAYQFAVGFDLVVVVTNDCTDGTDQMLDLLAASDDRIVHIRNQIAPGEAPQVAGMRLVLADARVQGAAYLLHCDADEFLHVSVGAGCVDDLLRAIARVTPDAPDCIALAWRPFGDAGNLRWDGGSVIEACPMADNRPRKATVLHKSMFRPDRFEKAIDHMPKAPLAEDVRLVNAAGAAMDPAPFWREKNARYTGLDDALITWQNACIHHYAIRSRDVFLMKNDRGDGMGLTSRKYFVNSVFWTRYNRNAVAVPEARQHLPAVLRIMAEFRAQRPVARLERAALDAFAAHRDAVLTPGQIADWTEAGPT